MDNRDHFIRTAAFLLAQAKNHSQFFQEDQRYVDQLGGIGMILRDFIRDWLD